MIDNIDDEINKAASWAWTQIILEVPDAINSCDVQVFTSEDRQKIIDKHPRLLAKLTAAKHLEEKYV